MKRVLITLVLILTVGTLLGGCNPSTAPTDSPLATPGGGQIQSPVSTPVPTVPQTEDDLPTPSSPDLATIGGVLIRDRHGQESVPMDGYTVYLAEVLYSEDGRPALASVGDDSPMAVTDENGHFVFLDVPPETYGFAISTPLGEFLYEDPEEGEVLFTVEPGQVLDLGELHTDIPY